MIIDVQPATLTITVHYIHIYRHRTGPDRVHLITAKKSPAFPFLDLLGYEFLVARGQGPAYCAKEFPQVETHLFDYSTLPDVPNKARAVGL